MRLDLSSLRDTFRGSLVTPDDPGYEAARVLFNTRVRRRPEVLARCAGTADVVAAVRFAREAGAPISVRGGGHHACGFSLVEGGVVIDVGGLKNVSFDPATGTVVAGAGCGWRDIDRVTYVGFSTEGEAGLRARVRTTRRRVPDRRNRRLQPRRRVRPPEPPLRARLRPHPRRQPWSTPTAMCFARRRTSTRTCLGAARRRRRRLRCGDR